MKHVFTSALIALCFNSFSQEADTLLVPQQTSSLQEAIDIVSDGGVIVLGEGTYEHGQTFVVDHKSITIQGCCSAEDVVLSGSASHRVLDIFGDENHAVVVQNLTIAFGRPGADNHASALKVHDCQATFSQVIIENNGGGTGNTVAYGSGIESTLFERCIVRNNSVENYAGLRSATARKCILHGNGGWNNTGVLLDCESYNCSVYGNGGGAGNPWTSSGLSGGVARNCIFWNNSAQSAYNPESVEYCLNSGHSGVGNIEGNPLFVDPNVGEFGLMPASPAVDAGDPNPIFNDADGSRNDMGAIALNEDFYVLTGCTDPLSCNYNADVEEDDGSCLPYDALVGCVDETACNFNVDALCSDESCVYPLIAGDCESGSIACAEGTNWNATLQQCVPIESPAPCGEGTYWDAVNEECAVLMPSDANFDGCVGMIDLLDLLTVFGTCPEVGLEHPCGEGAFLPGDDIACAGWNYLGAYDGGEYYLSSIPLAWDSAQAFAADLNGGLAVISSQEENDWISNLVGDNYVWIGLYQDLNSTLYSEPDGGWGWVDGSPFVYENWSSNSPNNVNNGTEHHCQMYANGLWNDAPGDLFINGSDGRDIYAVIEFR